MVTGFRLLTETTITALTPIQGAAKVTGGGKQQYKTVKVMVFVSIKGFLELVKLRPF